MHIICTTPLAEGVYNDHKAYHITAPPEGWAYIPTEDGPIPEEWKDTVRDYSLPSTFPRLGSIEVEELTYIREVEVPMTREVSVLDEDGNPVLDDEGNPVTKPEEYMDTEEREYTMLTVTNMTEGTLPEVVEEETEPTQLDRVEAQATYTAMMTDTLLEV